MAEGTIGNASSTSSGAFATTTVPQLSELMAFNGAPEIINGRLSMLGMLVQPRNYPILSLLLQGLLPPWVPSLPVASRCCSKLRKSPRSSS